MSYCTHFEVNKYITFQYYVVEHKVNEIVLRVCAYELLACHEGEAASQLHDEILQMANDGGFEFLFREVAVLLEPQELGNDGTLEHFKLVRMFLFHRQLRLSEVSLEVLCADVAVQCAHTPHFLRRCLKVPAYGDIAITT